MATKYHQERKTVEENPGVHPIMREWAKAVNASISWATTTTTTSTTTTSTTAPPTTTTTSTTTTTTTTTTP